MNAKDLSTGVGVRLAARNEKLKSPTSGLAPGYLQANLIILPSRYADDFRQLCRRNPVACPLIAESTRPGNWNEVKSRIPNLAGSEIIGKDLDIRSDAPRYMIYSDSILVKAELTNIRDVWTSDHVAFLIGCSFSFEAGLELAGLPPRHIVAGRNVPMYRTKIPLCAAGVFADATYVVSMRPYKRKDVERVRDITRRFGLTHGEPVDWGFDAARRLGIGDLERPEWGEAPSWTARRASSEASSGPDDEIPVFWGCGITTQEAVMKARLSGTVMAQAPGHMLVLDCRDTDVFPDQ